MLLVFAIKSILCFLIKSIVGNGDLSAISSTYFIDFIISARSSYGITGFLFIFSISSSECIPTIK